MSYLADLHVHSYHSLATGKTCDLAGFHAWAQRKGVQVVATGDFTHPGWLATLREQLISADNGLFRLRPELAAPLTAALPPSCHQDVQAILSTEVNCIYKRDNTTRRVHALLYAPNFAVVDTINSSLAKYGKLQSDGRPILRLDCRDLLDIVLNASADAWLVPAHIWTPWYSMLGSKSGFDSPQECFGDLIDEIFAAETGLSSDLPMNRLVSSLDNLTMISNSDAHSPSVLGRNATIFHGSPSFMGIRRALSGIEPENFGGTIDLYPEQGKYHLDGHRACEVCLEPSQSQARNNLCPVCNKPLVLGVLHRVMQLADRSSEQQLPNCTKYTYIIPLTDLLAEIKQCGKNTKKVQNEYGRLLKVYGSEDYILRTLELQELKKEKPLLAEAIKRVRQQKVIRKSGFDGQYGSIRVFSEQELTRAANSSR